MTREREDFHRMQLCVLIILYKSSEELLLFRKIPQKLYRNQANIALYEHSSTLLSKPISNRLCKPISKIKI